MSLGPIWGKVVGLGLWGFYFPNYQMLLLNQQPLFKLQSHEHKISPLFEEEKTTLTTHLTNFTSPCNI